MYSRLIMFSGCLVEYLDKINLISSFIFFYVKEATLYPDHLILSKVILFHTDQISSSLSMRRTI